MGNEKNVGKLLILNLELHCKISIKIYFVKLFAGVCLITNHCAAWNLFNHYTYIMENSLAEESPGSPRITNQKQNKQNCVC